MKKIIIASLSCLILFGFSLTVFAAEPTIPDSDITSMDKIIELLDTIVNYFFGIVLAVALFMLLFAGFKWITSSGNEEAIGTARKMLIWALVGIAIALVSKGLIMVIKGLVGIN
ncbi:MAG: hypothetical protein ABIG88_01260 [Patescibacteria group bacterium]|nr:pilin [Patescibacteria group bacterium]